jgi:hypothetical protein
MKGCTTRANPAAAVTRSGVELGQLDLLARIIRELPPTLTPALSLPRERGP